MSVTTPAALASVNVYGLGYGRGDLEVRAIQTIRDWIVAYLADYERQRGLRSRTLPVPPTPESIHGGLDFSTFSGELLPEVIVVVQPLGTADRQFEDGSYGSWYEVQVAGIVHVEGDPESTRLMADAYGTALQKLVPQHGAFGFQADGVTDFATRTRLRDAYALEFPDGSVRDIMRATVVAETFVNNLVSDFEGPLVPPQDPYAVPGDWPIADQVKVDLIQGTPDTSGLVPADAVEIDATVVPTVVRYFEETVDATADTIPKPSG